MTSEIYTVRQGDTLGKIAARHGVSVDEIVQDNRIGNRNKISAGQRLNIPKKKEKTAQISHAKEDWSETVMRFVDSIGRPIVGLAVRLVAAGKELRGTTDASGCIAPVRCNNTNETIEIHVEKTPTRGGGEKKIASYVPRRGQQKVLVQSGMHVEKSALRAHEGSPERPPRKLPPTPAEPIETRTSGGNPLACSVGCECPNEDDLRLGANNVYREWVKLAALRAGLIPQAVAAVMNAEAVKVKKTGQWKEDSKSPGSSATGMTQFLDGSWVAEAVRSGTYLNSKARKEGWLKQDEKGVWNFVKGDGTLIPGPDLDRKLMKLFTGKRVASDKNLQKLIDLRYEAEFAIMAAMDYAKVNLGSLGAKGYAIDDLNDTEKARIMYLCHHLGLTDAIHFIQDDIPEEDVVVEGKDGKKRLKQNGAKKLLTAQVGETDAEKKYVKPNGDSWVRGHRKWLERFMRDNITPHLFCCPGEKLDQLKIEEENGVLLDITEKLKK